VLSSITYRDAAAEDAAAIGRLHAESWRAHYRGAYADSYLDGPVYADRDDVWRTRFASPPYGQYVVVAYDGDELVGFACAYGNEDEHWGTLLDNLHVRTDLHRSGIGRRLVTEIARWCFEHHPNAGLYLYVLAQNTNARAFYERLGGRDVGGEHREPTAGEGPPIEIRRIAWKALPLTEPMSG
jgi:ribosomal protein S18 acetylase RimI-like enzyme